MILYSKLAEKFIDKGYLMEFHYFVLPPPLFERGKVLLPTIEEEVEFFNKSVYKIYGEDWEYWNQWIDHQNYK